MSKIGRNDPCPCGSGKKYKKCCELKESAPKKLTAHKIESEDLSNRVTNISGLFQKISQPQPIQKEEVLDSKEESKPDDSNPASEKTDEKS